MQFFNKLFIELSHQTCSLYLGIFFYYFYMHLIYLDFSITTILINELKNK